MMDAKSVAELLLDAKALTLNVKEPYTYASGIKSPIYTDCRLLMSDVEKRRKVVDSYVAAFKAIDCDLIAATAAAGIPWGAWVADRLDLPMVFVRKDAKDHGKGRKIEGAFVSGARAAVVEDLVSTAGSSIATVDALKAEGLKVENCVSIFTYGMAEAEIAFKKAGVKLYTLSNFAVALGVAQARGYLSPQEVQQAKEWAVDPKRWRQ
jgi:orotate phosphoribosyltransferase